jgi:FMN phosphatase YigB (HAD superfamily)
MDFQTVIFDWRGTLVRTPPDREWVADAFNRLGVLASTAQIDQTVNAIVEANGTNNRLDAPGLDANMERHLCAYRDVFRDARLPEELAAALYESESDFRRNPFALDAGGTIEALKAAGVRVGILSDLHFDPRPAFQAAGILGHIDAFAISCELGLQKPDPAFFSACLEMLATTAEDTLMVGDRPGPDGAAVDLGMTTLLVPRLKEVTDRRLHRVLKLCGVSA